MAISYGELAKIATMTNEKLEREYQYLAAQTLNEDGMDRMNAVEQEMELRGLPHP